MLTFELVKAYANEHGIAFEREGKGYCYWNKENGGAVVGHAKTLYEAYQDLESFF